MVLLRAWSTAARCARVIAIPLFGEPQLTAMPQSFSLTPFLRMMVMMAEAVTCYLSWSRPMSCTLRLMIRLDQPENPTIRFASVATS